MAQNAGLTKNTSTSNGLIENLITLPPSLASLPDFSYAGYHLGTVLPTRKKDKIFKAEAYGALPNDGLDDIDGIQAAVDAATAAGGGCVVLKAGVYDFDVNTTQRFVTIAASNVVVQGYGENIDGTVLIDHHASTWPNKAEPWKAGSFPSFFYIKPANATTAAKLLITKAAKAGAQWLHVRHAGILKANSVVELQLFDATDTSLRFALAYPLRKFASGNAKSDPKVPHLQQQYLIAEVRNDSVRLAAPLLFDVELKWRGVLVPLLGRISETGIENMTMKSLTTSDFKHHATPEDDNGYDAVKLTEVYNCWVRNVHFSGVTTAVSITNSAHCVVYDCRITGAQGHNGFAVHNGSTRNLLMRLQGGSQLHTWSLNSEASGNVFYNCQANEPSAVDCHGGFGIYNLFDNLRGGISANGGSDKNTPPAHGIGLCFYNWRTGILSPYNYRIGNVLLDGGASPSFVAAGCYNADYQWLYKGIDDKVSYTYSADATILWPNAAVPKAIPSLYLYQRQLRLGIPLEPQEVGKVLELR